MSKIVKSATFSKEEQEKIAELELGELSFEDDSNAQYPQPLVEPSSLLSAQSFRLNELEISPKLAIFLAKLSKHGLSETLSQGKVVYADDESFNRAAMQAKFVELGIEDRLVMFPDGHQAVNYFT